jgi:hypothetical protein
METQRAVVVFQWRVALVGPLEPTAIDDPDDVCAGLAAGRHDVMEIVASFLSLKVGHDWREDVRGALLDGADDAAPHTAGDATPRAGLPPVCRLPLSGCVIWPWRSGRVGRRYRWARRPQPSLGRAKRPTIVASA